MRGKALFIFLILIVVFSSCVTPPQPREKLAEAAPMSLEDMQNSFRSIAEEVLPVVVEVAVVEIKRQLMPDDGFHGWPWDFSPSEPESGPDEREFRNEGLGSGVLVKKDKNTVFVLTNNHVIGDADEIEVTLYDQRTFPAVIVGKDERKDLALIKFTVEGEEMPVARIGDSDDIQVGDWVLAIGNPFGFNSTVTAGIVSAKGRSGPTEVSSYIQTDAAINQGNSGGALVNIRGELVGINTWIAAPTGGSIGLGFSIPINIVKRAIDDFIQYGEVQYGWLGVSVANLVPSYQEELGLESANGAFIFHLFEESPAAKGGLLPGDLILELNGVPIRDADQLVLMVGELLPGEKAVFAVRRGGVVLEKEVRIEKRREREHIVELNKRIWPGLSVVPINAEMRENLELPERIEGVLVREVENKTRPSAAGIRAGDIITGINGNAVKNVMDFYASLNDSGKEFEFSLYRDGNDFAITITR